MSESGCVMKAALRESRKQSASRSAMRSRPLFDLAQQQHAAIQRQGAAVEFDDILNGDR